MSTEFAKKHFCLKLWLHWLQKWHWFFYIRLVEWPKIAVKFWFSKPMSFFVISVIRAWIWNVFIEFHLHYEKLTMENMFQSWRAQGRAFGFPRPPRPPPSPTTVEPCQSPPFQDCWDGNVCQLDNQCGKNGRCKILMHDSCRPTGYVHIQKFKAHFQSCSLDKKGNVNCLLSRKTI